MKSTLPRYVLGAVVIVTAMVGLAVPVARSQVQATPSLLPIGVSSSGNASTVWFHEPASRQVVACQTAPAAGPTPGAIHCTTSRLP